MNAHPFPGSASDDRTLESLSPEPLLTRDFESAPGAVYERLRSRYGAVAPVNLVGVPVWLVLGYPEVLEVMQNQELWKRDIRHWRARSEGRLPLDWPLLPAQEVRHMMFLDGDEHRKSRTTFEAALKPFQGSRTPQAEQLKAAVVRYADDLINLASYGAGRVGWADLCAQYARPLPLMVINRLYGFPQDQGDDVIMDIWRMVDGGPDSAAAVERLLAAMESLVTAKRTSPGDDLPSRMLTADPDLSSEQLARELSMVAVYLSDVTSNLINNTVVEVIRGNAGMRMSLSAGLIGETVNRAAISNPPVYNLSFRFPVQDTELGNFTIAAGDVVVASIAAAHADPLFSSGLDPEATVSTRAHLAWGAGTHGCPDPAQQLGTMIVTTAVGRLFERFGGLQLTLPADQLPWRSAHIMRGLRSLPVRFELNEAVPGTPQTPAGPLPQDHIAVADLPQPASPELPARSSLWRFLTGLRRPAGS